MLGKIKKCYLLATNNPNQFQYTSTSTKNHHRHYKLELKKWKLLRGLMPSLSPKGTKGTKGNKVLNKSLTRINQKAIIKKYLLRFLAG